MPGNNHSNWIRPLAERLAAAGNGNAARSVEELAAHVLDCRPLEINFRGPTPAQQAELEKLIARAEQGEPIQYIIGHVDFRGLEIRCDRRALIPRPETEQLVEQVLQSVPGAGCRVPGKGAASALRIADVGTGTGCIALALAHELPDAAVTAVDISAAALALAQENAERLGLGDRIAFVRGNLLDAAEEASLDIIVSNPPYIVSDVWKNLEPCVRDFEPKQALDGGADGLDLIRRLAAQAAAALKPGGALFLEIGFDQGGAVAGILNSAGFRSIEIRTDLAGHDRMVSGRL